MEFLEKLSRSEMKNIKGGNECAIGCLSLYGGYYEECDATYPQGTDGRYGCNEEVHELSVACLNDCF